MTPTTGSAETSGGLHVQWWHRGLLVANGPGGAGPGGGTVAGADQTLIQTGPAMLTIAGVQTSDAGDFAAILTNMCGSVTSAPSILTVIQPCGSADFNHDGDTGTDADIDAFFACLSGLCPLPPCPNSADFDADGDVGTDQDIDAFFRVLAGGSC